MMDKTFCHNNGVSKETGRCSSYDVIGNSEEFRPICRTQHSLDFEDVFSDDVRILTNGTCRFIYSNVTDSCQSCSLAGRTCSSADSKTLSCDLQPRHQSPNVNHRTENVESIQETAQISDIAVRKTRKCVRFMEVGPSSSKTLPLHGNISLHHDSNQPCKAIDGTTPNLDCFSQSQTLPCAIKRNNISPAPATADINSSRSTKNVRFSVAAGQVDGEIGATVSSVRLASLVSEANVDVQGAPPSDNGRSSSSVAKCGCVQFTNSYSPASVCSDCRSICGRRVGENEVAFVTTMLHTYRMTSKTLCIPCKCKPI